MKIKLYFIAFLSFLALDSLWLGLVAPKFYRSQIGFLMAESPNFVTAGVFYLLYIVGMVVFVVEPGVKSYSVWQAVLRGAFFGLITYGTYDLTNLATLARWPLLITVVDMLWGAALCSLVTLVSVWAGKRLKST
ncbi:MAG: DUF2177 family protein [Anaerolineales bacterium]|nr:DUF2177 family protein [Anaerolineales bacterium]